tara:strand:+ start:581 stop:754 length:174 start_codon:yes stop_codon:yes gene_type:complete
MKIGDVLVRTSNNKIRAVLTGFDEEGDLYVEIINGDGVLTEDEIFNDYIECWKRLEE